MAHEDAYQHFDEEGAEKTPRELEDEKHVNHWYQFSNERNPGWFMPPCPGPPHRKGGSIGEPIKCPLCDLYYCTCK